MADNISSEIECLDKIANFLLGFRVIKPGLEDFETEGHMGSWNQGIGVAVSQMFDEDDNQEVIDALREYARQQGE